MAIFYNTHTIKAIYGQTHSLIPVCFKPVTLQYYCNTLQKGTIMIKNSPQYAVKMGRKNMTKKFSSSKAGSFHPMWWKKEKKIKNPNLSVIHITQFPQSKVTL